MKNPLTLLVVEDRDEHLEDLRAVLAAELPRIPLRVTVLTARDLGEALRLLPQADIVITDVFFPRGDSDAPDLRGELGFQPPRRRGPSGEVAPPVADPPSGMSVVAEALRQGKPVVWVTSTYHHGADTHAVSEWGRRHGLEMYDCYGGDDPDGESPHKPWLEALYGLLYMAYCVERGTVSIQAGKVVDGWSIVDYHDILLSPPDGNGYLPTPGNYPLLLEMLDMGFPGSFPTGKRLSTGEGG